MDNVVVAVTFGITLIFVVMIFSTVAYAKAEIHVGEDVYAPPAARWSAAIQNASFDSTSWIWSRDFRDSKHKNKSRDTILVIPTASTPDNITLVVWFHGLKGYRPGTFQKRVVPQLEKIVASDNSVAFVIPEMPSFSSTNNR